MKFTTFSLTLAISVLTLVGCSSTKSVVDRTRASVLRVTNQTELGPGVCTGFVVKPQTVITAAHCVGSLMQADGYEAKLLHRDEFYDLALLEVKLTNRVPLELRDDPTVDGEKLIGIGYAWGWNFPLSIHVTVLAPMYKPAPQLAMGIIVQGGYIHGMSGGPVIDLVGRVVGIVQQSNEGVGYGVGTKLIKAFLFDSGVE